MLVAAWRWIASIKPRRGDLRTDAAASLPVAIAAVPDGMATATLIGINPIHGLYAMVVGPIAGGLTTVTSRMAIAVTGASALAAASALDHVGADDRTAALFLLTLLVGVFMIAAGVARLGRYTRFVSHSVMVGFLTGISVTMILSQIPTITDTTSDAPTALTRFVDIVTNPGEIHLATLAVGAATIALLALLARTRIGPFAALVAIALPTAVVVITGLTDVSQVSDSGSIPLGLPLPALPEIRLLDLQLVTGAAAVAVIILVQAFGVAQTVPEPNAPPTNGNGDFKAQGVANIASGLFQGQPLGGSMSTTVFLRASGARSRWGGILLGVWMAVILALLAPVIGYVAEATLAAVLVYAGFTAINVDNIVSIWRTSPSSRVAMVVTFAATLAFPVQVAVGIGVAVSLMLQLNREAMDLRVVERVATPEGIAERAAPENLRSEEVTVLSVHGSLFFAGARTLAARLPDPGTAARPVVVLRLRGRMQLGATALMTLGSYAERLAANGGRLYLTGVSPNVMGQLDAIGVSVDGPVTAVPATEIIGESTRRAVDDATTWLIQGIEEET
jgi:sulfate permease, SulP family